MVEKTHSRLAPSSCYRWLACPGSARDDLPDTETEASQHGTLVHTIAELTVKGKKRWPKEVREQWNAIEPGLRNEFRECIDEYAEFVKGVDCKEMLHEVKLQHPHLADFGGTADTIALTEDSIHIVDLKSGSMPVGADGNKQLQCYTLLAHRNFLGRENFYATIVQTRVGPPKTTSFTIGELEDLELQIAEASTKDDLVAGSHCLWCPLLDTCPAVEEYARGLAEAEFDEL